MGQVHSGVGGVLFDKKKTQKKNKKKPPIEENNTKGRTKSLYILVNIFASLTAYL